MNEFDLGSSNYDLHINGQYGTFEKLKKTSAMMDESITNSFLRVYGIDGIKFGNME